MKNIVICSVCSREKIEGEDSLPARERYVGSHVSKVEAEANQKNLPLFFLSGWYGFISADEEIPYYDYLLTMDKVENLAIRIYGQLKAYGVEELHFYTKTKSNWLPYKEALSRATESLGIKLHIHELLEND